MLIALDVVFTHDWSLFMLDYRINDNERSMISTSKYAELISSSILLLLLNQMLILPKTKRKKIYFTRLNYYRNSIFKLQLQNQITKAI